MTLMAPRNEAELLPMLEHALSLNSPAAIRYPRGSSSGKHNEPLAPLLHGKAEVLRWGRGVAILAYGTTVDIALDASSLLCHPERSTLSSSKGAKSKEDVTVVNARFAKPLDEALLLELERDHTHVITLEEHSLAGGFGTAVAEFVSDHGLKLRVERIGVPNVLVQHDSQDKQRALFGLTADALAARVRTILGASTERLEAPEGSPQPPHIHRSAP
jgi:1-deoxy-D-xylulose-5-phosphate synthase